MVFLLFALSFFWYYLPQGFAPVDDGYMVGLGHRIASGQDIYRDFYFFRTPLSPYIQAGLISLFGSAYTILWSKVYWALQLFGSVLLLSLVYRSWLNSLTLTLTLCATLVYSALLFAFPWYSYDGMFFAALFAVLVMRKRYLLAGVGAGMAFLAKQGFIVIVPVFLLVWIVSRILGRSTLRPLFQVGKNLALGWVLPLWTLSIYYYLDDRLSLFLENVFLLPGQINDLSFGFMIYQDLPAVWIQTWVLFIPLFLALAIRFKWWPGSLALVCLAVWYWAAYSSNHSSLPLTLTAFSYLFLLFAVVSSSLRSRMTEGSGSDSDRAESRRMFWGLAIALTYAAGFSYDGWIFSYVAGVISIPAVVVALGFLGQFSQKDETAIENADSPWSRFVERGARWQQAVFASIVLASALVVHHNYPYLSETRAELSVPFQTPGLAGIVGRESQVAAIDSLMSYVRENTGASERIFVFPDHTSLNVLTDRPAWGLTHWHYKAEYDLEIAERTVALLQSDPPDLVILQTHVSHDPYQKRIEFAYLDSEKEKLIVAAIHQDFVEVDTVGFCHILRPVACDTLTMDAEIETIGD